MIGLQSSGSIRAVCVESSSAERLGPTGAIYSVAASQAARFGAVLCDPRDVGILPGDKGRGCDGIINAGRRQSHWCGYTPADT
jgi:hypothetical protein